MKQEQQPVTPNVVLYICVGTLSAHAILSLIIIGFCAIYKIEAPAELTTALITLASGAIGALSAMLVNTRNTFKSPPAPRPTRSSPQNKAVRTKTTTTTTKETEQPKTDEDK